MKNIGLIVAVVLILAGEFTAFGQGTEKKAFREYTSPQELVSIAPSTPLDKALAAISEVSQKFIGKIVIDTERRQMPINVDIQGLQWRDALEVICRKNDLWYTEYENYIQITGAGGTTEGGAAGAGGQAAKGGMVPAGGGGQPGTFEIPRELANFRSREVRIYAVFFEVNLDKVDQVGLNWTFMKSTNDYTLNMGSAFADQLTSTAFKIELTPKISFANIDILGKIFSNYNLGEILSNPQITVRSGEEGRIQVGQDFSIRERDFAGNLIDRFFSAGTIIKIKPQVITEQGVNFIHLDADVERSSVVPGAISTIINKTKATTNVLLLDGEETIIGGLYNDEIDQIRIGVPFLKDLPWWVFGLRYLFGYQSDETIKKELVILLKAELVPTLQERITQKAKEEGLFNRWLDDRMRRENALKGPTE